MFDVIKLIISIRDYFAYTVCPLGLILNILKTVAIIKFTIKTDSTLETRHQSRGVRPKYILPEIVYLLNLENVEYVSASLYSFNVAVYKCFYSSVMLVSLIKLLALAIDYYIAIVKPLHYSRIVTSM